MLRTPPLHHLHARAAIAALAMGVAATSTHARPDGDSTTGQEAERVLDQGISWVDRAQQRVIAFKRSTRAALDHRIELARRPLGIFLAQGPIAPGHAAWLHVAATTSDDTPLPVEGASFPGHLVLLIHGLDEGGDVWHDLAPALAGEGRAVARFDYPSNQAISRSADLLAAHLRSLRSLGVSRIDIVAHSMGGLIARDALTRGSIYAGDAQGAPGLPAVRTLIMIGTPHAGSPWARLEPVAQAINMVDRATAARQMNALLGFLTEGDGQAGRDLLPDSEFLADLNARPAPRGVRLVSIVGSFPMDADNALARAAPWLSRLAGPTRGERWSHAARAAIASAQQRLGDGVVSVGSASTPAFAGEVVRVRAGHRGMLTERSPDTLLRRLGVDADAAPAIPIVVERLRDADQIP